MPGYSRRPKSDPTSNLAQLACLCLGVALLIWGLAPAIMERLISSQPPRPGTLGLAAAIMLVGLTFGVLSLLIARNVPWAPWVTLGLSAALLLGSLGMVLAGRAGPLAAIVALLPATAAFTSWLTINARRRTERAAGRL